MSNQSSDQITAEGQVHTCHPSAIIYHHEKPAKMTFWYSDTHEDKAANTQHRFFETTKIEKGNHNSRSKGSSVSGIS
jgi:hypothetical protein